MEVVFGIKGSNFIILCADMTNARSILAYNHDIDKIKKLDEKQFIACAGDDASRTSFTDYIEKNFNLMKLRNGVSLSNNASANFIRNQLAAAIRSRGGAYQVSSLYATIDNSGPALYYLDYLGTLQEIPFGAHGYGATFVTSQMDAANLKEMTVEQGVKLIKQCCDQLMRRYLINLPKYKIKIITADSFDQEIYCPNFKES